MVTSHIELKPAQHQLFEALASAQPEAILAVFKQLRTEENLKPEKILGIFWDTYFNPPLSDRTKHMIYQLNAACLDAIFLDRLFESLPDIHLMIPYLSLTTLEHFINNIAIHELKVHEHSTLGQHVIEIMIDRMLQHPVEQTSIRPMILILFNACISYHQQNNSTEFIHFKRQKSIFMARYRDQIGLN